MRIGDLQKLSTSDFPGKQAAVIHTQGCNLRCPFCHNPELVEPARFGPAIPEEKVIEFLRSRVGKLDAVVITGGEPTVHDDLPDFLAKVRRLGYAIKLETNGTRPEMVRRLAAEGLVDYIAMDVKAPLPNYAQLAGKKIDTEAIKTCIWVIKNSGLAHEFRTTVIPGMHTTRELKEIAELVHGCDCYVVQDFISDTPLRPDLKGRPAFPGKPLNDIKAYMARRVKRYEHRASTEAKHMPVGRRSGANASLLEPMEVAS